MPARTPRMKLSRSAMDITSLRNIRTQQRIKRRLRREPPNRSCLDIITPAIISPPFISECNRKSVSIDRCDNNGSNTADDGNYNRYRHVDHHLSLSIPGISGFLSFICNNQRSSQARRQTGNKDSQATCHKGTPEQRTENICSCEYPLEE